jgi:hypothetical protein
MKTKVYPATENALIIEHPIDGKLKPEGSDWEVDGFTCRMLADREITSEPPSAVKTAVSEKMQPKAASN